MSSILSRIKQTKSWRKSTRSGKKLNRLRKKSWFKRLRKKPFNLSSNSKKRNSNYWSKNLEE